MDTAWVVFTYWFPPSLATKSEFFLNEGVTSVAFLPTSEGHRVMGSSARALQLWDVTSKQCLAQFLWDGLITSTVADQRMNVLFYVLAVQTGTLTTCDTQNLMEGAKRT